MVAKSALVALFLHLVAAGITVHAQDSSSSTAETTPPAESTPEEPAPTTTPGTTGPAITPLASKHFTYTALPMQADTDDGERGRQTGYNICGPDTEGQDSLCQTALINSIDDFCLWGPPDPNSVIGDTEGEAVAWCTKPGHGTRVIPAGAITGVQFVRTPDYIQVTGNIAQANINIRADDSGGEMDPHGADQRGNPLGGLVFTNAFPASNGDADNYIQAVEWHNFMGENQFCFKACDPAGPNAARYCEHIFDRIGCYYNAPAPYEDDVFESCLGDSQDFPGVYTGANGVVSTFTQPPESLGEISTMPYQPVTPASSSCTTYQSAELFAGAPSGTLATSRTTTRTRSSATRSSTSTSTSSSGAAGVAAAVPRGIAAGLVVGVIGLLAGAAL